MIAARQAFRKASSCAARRAAHLEWRRGAAPCTGLGVCARSYLQRLVNGGGRIEREYGLGRGRTDLLVLWPREAGQLSDQWERFVVECKLDPPHHTNSRSKA